MQEAERRCLDISKQVDAAVGVRLDTERQLREQTNATITRLQDTVSESHKETVRVVSDCQSTSIEHAEVLRRLEQELLAFKLDTETKLTEEARKLSGVVVDQRKIGEGVELAAADSTLTRLKEVEHALLKEREMRKTLEHEVVAMRCAPAMRALALPPALPPHGTPHREPTPEPARRQVVAMRGERGATQAMVDEAVHASMLAHGGGTEALEEKVKECGRMILR